ncbi:MAG: TIGR02996 domain-containing protein [Gemmataceae bacterium]|nr:TIGR02996 domain-containing protein [Gemmataceae bacterium]
MTDHDALVRAVCEAPDDDTPRLVYADYLDDHGGHDRAAFVRAQVELARTPAWEPFAVLCRHRRPDWLTGDPFRHTLPPLPPGASVHWVSPPFRRGFGYRLGVRSATDWEEFGRPLFGKAPVAELHLWAAVPPGEWARHLRAVHLAANPVEPLRAVCAAPAVGLTDIHFHRADHPGMEFLVQDLLASPLRGAIHGLHFRTGYTDLEELLAALPGAALDRLTLANMGLTWSLLYDWCDHGGPERLTRLELSNNYGVSSEGVRVLAAGIRGRPGLLELGLSRCGVSDRGARALAGCDGLAGLRSLSLHDNPLSATAARALAHSPHLAGLRSLNLARCRLGDAAVRHLAKATFWPNLVELDLRGNPVSAVGAGCLLKAPVPPDLTALLLDPERLGPKAAGNLRRHFGGRVVLV